MIKDLLLINPPSAFTSYYGTRANAVNQAYPLLSLAYLAAVARREGFSVSILDLALEFEPYKTLYKVLGESSPRFIGITSTTPLFPEVSSLSSIIKNHLGSKTKLIIGGPHASALPEEALKQSSFDILVFGEGEDTLLEILHEKPLREITGIYYKEQGSIFKTKPRETSINLDSLPFPAFDLYDIKRYKCPRFLSRFSPLCNYMTSRGCVFDCTFCNKMVFGRRFRYKSPGLVIEEIEYILRSGIKEIRIADDMFTTDMKRAKTIFELIIKKGLKFPWTLAGGIRVDCLDEEFLRLAKRAGIYEVCFAFESGDQKSLDSINKRITLEQCKKAMKMVKKIGGLQTVGFFMLGLPADTEESLKKTLNFAIELMPDLAKATITTPFPGTALYRQYEKQGLIKSKDWTLYNLHKAEYIYQHPNLSHKILKKYYDKFYYKFYLNPKWLLRRLYSSIKNKTLFLDIYYGLQTLFPQFIKAK